MDELAQKLEKHRGALDVRWDDARAYDRGKVMTHDELDAGRDFGRYLDVDGDGIPYRTYPGTHASRGSFFTRGTTKDAYARYSERGPDYVYNSERLLRKFETAKSLVPAPVVKPAWTTTRFGVVYYGSTAPAMDEALGVLTEGEVHLDAMRVCGFPFADSVGEFVANHAVVFVVEQNRDGQLRSLLVNEFGIDPAKLVAVLHYDGTPITARFIVAAITERVKSMTIKVIRKRKGTEVVKPS